jgi:hypothetical protein
VTTSQTGHIQEQTPSFAGDAQTALIRRYARILRAASAGSGGARRGTAPSSRVALGRPADPTARKMDD